ncbi:glucocorticoid-induced transcript 1 protein [Colossoma macropomum]|uniref:glucocorticoid-induced transcript 1 protein n=1 Tax=Colossoma macropomum TaxID=42526 RepID=UPI001863B7A0|nr:glucocorticoid-induced transcript 1 protein [Colossoma macropomum]
MLSNGGGERGVPGLPPLRAAGPVELRRRSRPEPRNGAPAEKTTVRVRHQTQTEIRRTTSLDTILGPYLQGQWPREGERRGQSGHHQKDEFTQTSNWLDEDELSDAGGHKRSASWGNGDRLRDIAKLKQQLQHRPKPRVYGGIHERLHHPTWTYTQSQPVPIPLTSLTHLPSPMRQSEERLDQELERAFRRQSPSQHSKLLEIPDGRRAPVPSLSSCSSSQSEPSSITPHPSTSSSSSPCASPQCLSDLDTDLSGSVLPSCPSPLLSGDADASVLLSSSPRPNKSYCFQREPPEGCERIRVCEENISPYKDQPNLSFCPDPNKVNFTPHGGSAFCPVSLLKPLLPSVDFLFRSLSVSPGSCWVGQGGACQPPSPAVTMSGYMGPLEPATTAM